MRQRFNRQFQIGQTPISELQLNMQCRDEIIPIMAGIKYIYSEPKLKAKLLDLIGKDINRETERLLGREGFSYWQIIVLASMRLGCNLDYDKLQDLSENHQALRCLLQVSDLDDTNFSWRRIRDTLCLISAETIQQINRAIVTVGQELHGDARSEIRADSFVIETNIHYPTESNLILDGMRKLIPVCAELAKYLDESAWRQSAHLLKRVKKLARNISQLASSKSPKVKEAIPAAYSSLLDFVGMLLERAKKLQNIDSGGGLTVIMLGQQLTHWIGLTEQVCDNARRRVLLGESVPNDEKLFSMFETHTQLYRRGKAGTPNQFGRLLLVMEDKAGFISHYAILDRNATDQDVIVAESRTVQKVHQGEIQKASFDRGFYSEENAQALQKVFPMPCLPPRHPKKFIEATQNATVEFHASRQRHPGVESAIGALQRGNGLKRCRDRTEMGLAKYCGLAILGRNIQILGKSLISKSHPESEAARSKRAC
jgi:hypothetical protein